VTAADQSTYITLDTAMRKDVEEFVKDLEEQIKKYPAHKTNLEKIKSFYPTT
jgi:chloramphenicol O-acetyltransferase